MVNKDAVVVGRHSPVLVHVILVGVVLLVIREEIIQLDALSEVLVCFHASDVLQHIEVTMDIDTCSDKSVPVNAL